MEITLTITWNGPGTPVNISGPINDKMICYALLEAAKDAVREHIVKEASGIVVAPMMPNGSKPI